MTKQDFDACCTSAYHHWKQDATGQKSFLECVADAAYELGQLRQRYMGKPMPTCGEHNCVDSRHQP